MNCQIQLFTISHLIRKYLPVYTCKSQFLHREPCNFHSNPKMSNKMNKMKLSKGILEMKFMSRTREKIEKEKDDAEGR